MQIEHTINRCVGRQRHADTTHTAIGVRLFDSVLGEFGGKCYARHVARPEVMPLWDPASSPGQARSFQAAPHTLISIFP